MRWTARLLPSATVTWSACGCYAADTKTRDFDGNVLMERLEAIRGRESVDGLTGE